MAAPQPLGTGNAEGHRTDRVCEWNGEPDISEVQHRRVDGHQVVVLQQGIRPWAFDGCVGRSERPRTRGGTPVPDRLDAYLKGVGDCEHEPEEEDGNPAHDGQSSCPQTIRRPSVTAKDEPGVSGENESPQQDRALESTPGAGHIEWKGGGRRVVVGYVGEREIVGQESYLHCCHRHDRPGQQELGRASEVKADSAAGNSYASPDQQHRPE